MYKEQRRFPLKKLEFWTPLEIDYMGTKAKCRHLKNFSCKGTLWQVFICLRLIILYPSPSPYTLYTYVIRVYSILIHPGKGVTGVELNQRED